MRILITGAAGFIGHFVSARLLERGDEVLGLDNLNSYYDPRLKQARLERLGNGRRFVFKRVDVSDQTALGAAFDQFRPERVIHLAAQAGVRHALSHPEEFVQSNLVGTANVLECCRQGKVCHLTYASTSSVYGLNRSLPFRTSDSADHPAHFYAATKRACEIMAHSYSSLYGLPTTGLRFFTVYGPWGRPDMALFSFTKSIIEGIPIPVFNHGRHTRDMTYVDDVAEVVTRASDRLASPSADFDPMLPSADASAAPWRVYNVGGGHPLPLMDMIGLLEKYIGRKATIELLPMHPGDLPDTKADTESLQRALDFKPSISAEVGIKRFVDWYLAYYGH